MKKEPEVWKEIKGYEGRYEISSHGRVKRLERTITIETNNQHKEYTKQVTFSEKILSLKINRYGYVETTLTKNKQPKTILVHRLVGKAFIPNPKDKPCINHKDGVKDNNYYKNIEWVTRSENSKHSYEIGLQNQQGENHASNKFDKEEILEIRKKYNTGNYTQKELGKEYGTTQPYVSSIVNNNCWTHI